MTQPLAYAQTVNFSDVSYWILGFLCDSVGKTRTKDKYRVVYTDKQRLELENEFQYNSYITMRRKTELSMALGLSERQVRSLQSKIKPGVDS